MKAVVWSTNLATGSYSFVVTKQGVSGRSNVAQSGLFEVEASERKTVGTVMVNASRGDSYLARLLVRSGDDEVICDTNIESAQFKPLGQKRNTAFRLIPELIMLLLPTA